MGEPVLIHYGILRRSGRYPWGSGGDIIYRSNKMAAKGLSEKEIAAGLGMSIKELRNRKAIVKAEIKEAERINVTKQRESGMSVAAIAREFKLAPSTVRDLLKPAAAIKFKIIHNTAKALKSMVKLFGFVDVGEGSELWMGIPRPKMDNAIQLLKDEGYTTHKIYQEQLGSRDNKSTILVLAPPGTTYKQVIDNKAKIAVPNHFSNDKGLTYIEASKIQNVSSNRILVKYKDDGGGQKDGLIELRRGVPEFDLGDKAYAQVRIGVDGTHFMKGMAILRDDLPDGVDIVYNTNKIPTGNDLDAMKVQVENKVSPFKTVVKPNTYMDKNGKEIEGPLNIVGERDTLAVEGEWSTWNKTLASQVLSKQAPRIATKQLDISYDNAKAELNEIMSLTDPTVRNHLLMQFADAQDRAAVDLKAAALPRQTTNVLLPDPTMKSTEIYAPNYDNGETVSLVRYPHGGLFEIPTLTVNNKYSDLKEAIGPVPKDAIGIHPDVASQLSGADFDGDTVLVIPNRDGRLRTAPSIRDLETFDPITSYPRYDGMISMTESQKQIEMGKVSNLITDMTIKGANQSEIARAVKHSMVVIDAEKHDLNWKQSEEDHGIKSLKERYQGGPLAGAATLISKASSQYRVPARRDHYTIDTDTGEKVWSYTEETYFNKKGKEVPKTIRSTKMGESKDGYSLDGKDLSSGTVIEKVYADHANRMKTLGNQARLATIGKVSTPYNRQAFRTYRKEVDSLNAKYKDAVRSRPVERKAQIIGGEIFRAQKDANPGMSYAQEQKEKGRAIITARTRLQARKPVIQITSREWEAIESGAVTPTRLKNILRNADMDAVRQHATPRAFKAGLSTPKQARAKALIKSGYTAAEVANALGVSVAQIHNIE
jgi:DNA-binding CsgD family transcriptional regulator/peptidyl-tRNA hydrolase